MKIDWLGVGGVRPSNEKAKARESSKMLLPRRSERLRFPRPERLSVPAWPWNARPGDNDRVHGERSPA